MSKMDRILNSKKDKQTIYEIYRACRLCGAGAGYKMPIIQNVVDVDDTDVELKQKIRECVQIEVHQDDKMPPLICELCVDKVNDFYEFFEMCRQTNKRTRLRLGLPPQSMPRGTPDTGECILGITEPVYVNDDSDGEPLAKQKKLQPKVKVKKEPELKIKIEKNVSMEARSSRHKSSQRSATPPRMTRHSRHSKEDNVSLSRLQDKSSSPRVTPKSILKKESKTEDNSLLTPRPKRSRDKEPVKLETPVKKVKITIKSPPRSTLKSPKTSPRISKLMKSAKVSPKRAPSPPPRMYKCTVCGQENKTPQGTGNHMRSHIVTFTSPRLACNPCGLWFVSADEAASHHKHHRSKSMPYNCRRCTADFKHLSAYEEHFGNNQCMPSEEVPDVKCEVCWHLFATNKLLEDHRCLGEDHRPGGKCPKCNRSYALLKNLRKHEQSCTAKKKGELIIDPVLLGKVRPIQVRVSRCDPLLGNIKQEHYDVSNVTTDFGLDKNCDYPYISSRLSIKSEPDFDGMVAIKDEIKEEFCTEENFIHWDSDESESDEDVSCQLVLNPYAKKKRVDTLATLTLKTLFSQRCLGRVPRKRRRVKKEKSVFDSLLGNDADDKVTRDINNIIDNLGDDDELDGVERKEGHSSQKNKESGDRDDKKKNDDDKIIIFDDIDEKSTDFDTESRNGVEKGAVEDKVIENDVQDNNTDNIIKSNNNISMDGTETNDGSEKDQNGPSNDLCENNSPNHEEKDIDSKNDGDSECNEENRSNSNKINILDDNVKFNNGSNSVSKVESCNDAYSLVNEVESRLKEVESDVIGVKSTDAGDESIVNDIESKTDEGNTAVNECKVNAEDTVANEVENKENAENTVGNKVESEVNAEIAKVNEVENKVNAEETKSNDENDTNDTESMQNEDKNDFDYCMNNSRDSNSVGTFNESLLNDTTQSDVVSESEKEIEKDFNAKCNSDNATSMSELNAEKDEIKSRQNYFSMENLNQHSKMLDLDMNLNRDSTKTNDVTLNNDKNTNHSDIDDRKNAEKMSNDTEEMDDSKLMEALDAEIGETNQRRGDDQDNVNDKIALEDLITSKNPEKSLGIDVLPDEFSFES